MISNELGGINYVSSGTQLTRLSPLFMIVSDPNDISTEVNEILSAV
jgi:hypothetical protein